MTNIYSHKNKRRVLNTTERSIAFSMVIDNKSIKEISERLNVFKPRVLEIFVAQGNNLVSSFNGKFRPVQGLEKRTEYYTEIELLSSPFYGSSKYKSKEKLIKGWELYKPIE